MYVMPSKNVYFLNLFFSLSFLMIISVKRVDRLVIGIALFLFIV